MKADLQLSAKEGEMEQVVGREGKARGNALRETCTLGCCEQGMDAIEGGGEVQPPGMASPVRTACPHSPLPPSTCRQQHCLPP